MLKCPFERIRKALIIAVMLLIISSPAIAASMQVSIGANILPGQNTAYFLVQSSIPINGSVAMIASSNLAPSSVSINLYEQDFSYSQGIYSAQKSQALNALSVGQYFITAVLSNNSAQIATDSKSGNIVLSLDLNPPQIISASPTGTINSTYALLYVLTNENSTCRASFEDGEKTYGEMPLAMSGAGTAHYYNTTLLEGDYTGIITTTQCLSRQ
jgi:hypothetical protein